MKTQTYSALPPSFSYVDIDFDQSDFILFQRFTDNNIIFFFKFYNDCLPLYTAHFALEATGRKFRYANREENF